MKITGYMFLALALVIPGIARADEFGARFGNIAPPALDGGAPVADTMASGQGIQDIQPAAGDESAASAAAEKKPAATLATPAAAPQDKAPQPEMFGPPKP